MNVCLSIFLLLGVFSNPALSSDDPATAAMDKADTLLAAKLTVLNNKAFLVAQNATANSSAEYLTEAQTYGQLYKQEWNATVGQFLLTSLNDNTTYRRYLVRQRPGVAGLDQDKYNKYLENVQSMKKNYRQKICPYTNKNCKDDDKIDVSDVENIMANTTHLDTAALKYYWQTFQNTAAKPSRDAFISASQHMNDAATLYHNGYTDAAEMSLQPYVTVDFTAAQVRDQVEQLWAALRPHYVSLMGYVRWKLRQNHDLKKSIGAADAGLPAHILGSLSGGSWENLYDLVVPFPKEKLPEFKMTGNATTSLGKLEEDMKSKWNVFTRNLTISAKIERKTSPDLECHPSVFDLTDHNKHTYGLTMCGDRQTKTEVLDAHELLGRLGYMDAYNTAKDNLPLALRAPGNPAMLEAAGGAVGLSAASMAYISKHGTNPKPTNPNHTRINQLMYMALRKFAVLPYAYVMDSFRYQVYNGSVSSDYNYNWWTLRLSEQGVLPPVRRERNDDFDVGGHYAVAHNRPLTSQFLGILLQFQLHEKMCSIRSQADPTKCNIAPDGVPHEFQIMMASGNKQPWTKTLSTFLAGSESTDFPINADAINNYFKDLWTYLNETQEGNYTLGWSTDLSKEFVEHIPATVPIIVGAVLAAMIVVVVIAYFVGKKRSAGAEDTAPSVEEGAGSTNHGYEMEERKESSASSSSSSSDGSKSSKH